MLFFCVLAFAGDTWSDIRPGLQLLHRTTGDPLDIYAVRADLSVPNIGLHASADNGGERGVITSTFAKNANVVVAINGDWSDHYTPVGLAISDGNLWNSHIQNNDVGGAWGFLACTASKECDLKVELPLDQAWWFGSPTLQPYRYYQSIGANGIPMLSDGVPTSGCFDSSLNPRSMACIEQDRTHLWLIVVDGRSGSSVGLTCDGVRQLMMDIDCWDGVMLDGGGSSTLVVDGVVQNNPSDGSERVVANHFGIIYSDTIDSRCTVANGRFCDGTVISACQGGRLTGSGDCGYYGLQCQEDGDYAFCVDPRCPNGDGLASVCLDGTHVGGCNDGQYSEGDCGVFGLACGTDAGGTSCMDARCSAGPHSSFCASDALIGACTDGSYAETTCENGTTCYASDGSAICLDSRCTAPDMQACQGDVVTSCNAGVYTEENCAANGGSCEDGACVGGESGEKESGTGELPGSVVGIGEEKPCGCDGGGGWVGAFLPLWLRRRRAQR